ncbi:hypothetical protein JHK87_001078 [Glycine soja]|nr:hypothetical protein JHK87_001078 [Glycine soja]
MPPNHWDPFSKTLIFPLHSSPSSFLISLSQHSQSLAVRVHATHTLSPQQQNPITAQVSRMLHFSEVEEKDVREFKSLHVVDDPNRSFSGRVFRSLTLFEDMVKCILLCNC